MPYIAFVYPPEDGSGWGVTFPDVAGCVSGGASFEDAVEAAREALAGHLAVLATDGDPPPPARTLADLRADPEARAEAEGALVQLILPDPQAPIGVPIDRALLERTDAAAQAQGLSRSAFIEAALSAAAAATR